MKIEIIHVLLTIQSVCSALACVSQCPAEGKINCRHILVCDSPSFIMILLSIWICKIALLGCLVCIYSSALWWKGPSSLQWMVCYSTAKVSPSCAKLQVSLVSAAEGPRALRVVQVQCVGLNFDTRSPEVQEFTRLT